MRAYALLAAVVAWFGLILQYGIVLKYGIPGRPNVDLVTRTVDYLSFFTILSNFLAALTLTFAALPSSRAFADFFARPSVRGGVALYMAVTGLVYFFLLRNLRQPEGWSYVANATLHYVMPPVYVLFWLLLAARSTLNLENALVWLVFPLVYVIYWLLRGPVAGYYPYPFLDVAKLGYPQTFINIAMLLVGFVVLALILVALDRAIGKRRTG